MLVKTMSVDANAAEEMKICIACKKPKIASSLINDLCPDCRRLSGSDITEIPSNE